MEAQHARRLPRGTPGTMQIVRVVLSLPPMYGCHPIPAMWGIRSCCAATPFVPFSYAKVRRTAAASSSPIPYESPHRWIEAQLHTAKRGHRPGTPYNSRSPRSLKWIPEPMTRSLTIPDTKTSPVAASAPMRAATWTASPLGSFPLTSHSPVCRPTRRSMLSDPVASAIAFAQRELLRDTRYGGACLYATSAGEVHKKHWCPSAAYAVTAAGSPGVQRTVSQPGPAVTSAIRVPCRRSTSTVVTAGPHRKTAKENLRRSSNGDLADDPSIRKWRASLPSWSSQR
jgi:hypothetical protein